jgi:hypothetical protein
MDVSDDVLGDDVLGDHMRGDDVRQATTCVRRD